VSILVLSGCAVATIDPRRTEHASGHVIIDGRRIAAVGAGAAPEGLPDARYLDASGCLATPGLINTHHHLYQWATRGQAVDATLFGWLTELYPVWAGIDEQIVRAAATAALAWLARTGCTTTMDHHYIFPRGGGDLLAATVQAAGDVGLRFHPTRGSMDLGQSSGGLPPDSVVEDRDEILTATQAAIDRFHDPGPDSMLRIGIAPCSPFTVTRELMTEAAALARARQVRLHTHLSETADEVTFCAERYDCSPVEYAESLGWLGPDVWLAHAVHLSGADIARLAATGTGVAHCPSSNARLGAGICRSRDLLDAGAPVGLGVDGAASNEASSLLGQARAAALFARAVGGPQAMTVRQALELATMGGAGVLGRQAEIGSLEPGKLADIALWRLDTLPHADIADPVAALVLGAQPPLELLTVGGRTVVERDRVVTVDERQVSRAARQAALALAARAAGRQRGCLPRSAREEA
jgi:cytosine/adenosine deaminase-related metal-dependent hydrolase